MPFFVYIHAPSGLEKLAIARKLQTFIPDSKLYDHHLLLDPIAPLINRTSPDYEELRTAQRRLVLDFIATSESIKKHVWIFTDATFPGNLEHGPPENYRRAVEEQGLTFVPVALSCRVSQTIRKLRERARKTGDYSRVTDEAILLQNQQMFDMQPFHTREELMLNVTSMSVDEAACNIFEHLSRLDGFPSPGINPHYSALLDKEE